MTALAVTQLNKSFGGLRVTANVDLVVELELRGAKRLQDQVMIALLHHPSVRTVSRGE